MTAVLVTRADATRARTLMSPEERELAAHLPARELATLARLKLDLDSTLIGDNMQSHAR